MWHEDSRLLLRRLTEQDVTEAYVGWLNDPVVMRYLDARKEPQTLETVRAFVRGIQQSSTNYLFGLFLRSTGQHIGNIKIGNIRQPHRLADLGLLIGERSVWGQGYGTEAIRLATRLAFEELSLNKLWAGTWEPNRWAYAAFRQANWREVGRFHRHIWLEGRFVDSILMEKCHDPAEWA